MREGLQFGEVEGLKIDVISETGWFDDAKMKDEMMAYGGPEQSQYRVPWSWDNAGGYSALITVTLTDGDQRKILLDTGWNTEWMDYAYGRLGVDAMLERGEIDFMVLSHWHLDHFWGIESTLKHNPGITIYAPRTWSDEDRALLTDKAEISAETHDGEQVSLCKNGIAHEGELIQTDPRGAGGDGIYRPLPGMALRMFDVPILLQVRGENVLYFNVKDKGVVTVTGCGHPGVMNLLHFAKDNFADDRLYGCYGGLHLSIFDTWKPEFDEFIDEMRDSGMEKVACNHCTGWMWAEKAARRGVPIIKGTDTYLSYPKHSSGAKGSRVFLGNGDSITF